jgi:hypothetical protein
MCDPGAYSSSGVLVAVGHLWVVANTGSSGTITISATATGRPDAGIAGEPSVSKPFTVLAGTTYMLIVGLPIARAACPEAPCTGPKEGPLVTVTVPGLPAGTFSFTAVGSWSYPTTATGEPVISLEEGSDPMVTLDSGIAVCIGLPADAG